MVGNFVEKSYNYQVDMEFRRFLSDFQNFKCKNSVKNVKIVSLETQKLVKASMVTLKLKLSVYVVLGCENCD